MNVRRGLFFAGLLVVSFLLTLNGAFAQAPSLAASDQYAVTVKTADGDETFTVIRDGRIEEQFYYVPIKPVVAYQKLSGSNKKMPVFQLLSYQTKDGSDKLVQGGILQLSMVMGVPQTTVDKILEKIKAKIELSDKTKKHLLSPMPIKSSVLSLYDMGGELLDQAPPQGGIAPVFGTQHYPFMLKLKTLGSDVMEALCRNQGGLPILITYTYQGMTPKGGFAVEVNWDTCYEHLSTNTQLQAEVGQMLVKGGLGLDLAKIREEFVTSGMMKVTSLSNEAVTSEQLDDMMSPILNLITKEMFEQINPPTSIEPASAKEMMEDKSSPVISALKSVGDLYGRGMGMVSANVKVAVAMKDVKIVKKGKLTYKFDRQAIIDRTTSFGGLLGIGNYPKDIQDKCISTMPAGSWESAYYVLPPVGDPEELGISGINISVIPEEKVSGADKWKQISGYKIESAGFNKRNNYQSWIDKDGKDITRLLFPLKALYDSKDFNSENYRFKIETTIQPKTGKTITLTAFTQLFDGDLPIAPPTDLVDVLTIDGSCLTFGEDAGQVVKATGQVKAGKQAWGILLNSEKNMQSFMVPAAETNITVPSLNFAQKSGLLGKWKNCNKNLRDLEPSLWFMIYDGDWQETVDPAKLPEDAIVAW